MERAFLAGRESHWRWGKGCKCNSLLVAHPPFGSCGRHPTWGTALMDSTLLTQPFGKVLSCKWASFTEKGAPIYFLYQQNPEIQAWLENGCYQLSL